MTVLSAGPASTQALLFGYHHALMIIERYEMPRHLGTKCSEIGTKRPGYEIARYETSGNRLLVGRRTRDQKVASPLERHDNFFHLS